MVRGLLGNVVAAGAIGVVPVAGEDLAEDGVEGLLDASTCVLDIGLDTSRRARQGRQGAMLTAV